MVHRMLFIYTTTVLRGSLSVGVMFTFLLLSMIIIAKNVDSMPIGAPEQFVAYTGGKDYSFDLEQHLVKFREPHWIILWIAVAIVGIFVAFVMIICPCVTYCCASYWVVLSTAQSNSNSASWKHWILRKLGSQRKRTTAKESSDPPPAYEVILAILQDQRVVGAVVEDEEPPSYTDALLNIESGAL